MLHVREINEIRQLDEIRSAWNALLEQTPGANFFQSIDWLECYWQHFGEGQRLRVLIVREDQRVIGILPLVVRTEKTRVGRLRVLTYPLHDWGTFYGPIGPDPTSTLAAGLRHVRQTSHDWDLLDLRWVDAEGADCGQTERAMEQAGSQPHKQAWASAPIIDLSGGWQQYWRSRDTKFRKNIDRCERRLREAGEVKLVRYRPKSFSPVACDGTEPPQAAGLNENLYDECVAISERSWQGSADDGTTLCHPQVRDFLRDAHAAATRRGEVDLLLLLLDGRPIAFIYCYCCQGRIYGLRKGFDPQFASLHPGHVLQKMMLEDGCRRGDSVYDLGVGYHDTKRYWQTGTAVSYRFTHFPITIVRAQLMRLSRWIRRRIRGERDIACGQGV